MKLSEIVKAYRAEHDMSMDALARCSGVTKGYISMIENERNPSTGKPISPSVDTLSKLARGMGMELDDLIHQADDMVVSLEPENPADLLTPDEIRLITKYRLLNRDGRRRATEYIDDLADNQKYTKDIGLLDA